MEKFIVSARKYRPQTFDTVVGQEHITTTLKNAIRNQQLAHAFLFCGPRGVGKTTCARILAKTINCENRTNDAEACNQCQSCISFNNGSSLNIHELDAASNNSVDDIRSLVEQVRFAPQAGKYKVYIIDEVHMLSQAAFNAFLKTLEEPPSYAIFILATTEKHKIIPTILSRCQIFDFRRITLQDTVDHLQGIANREQIKATEAALQLIAQKSEGCMRDALSILDKIVSFTNGQVSYENTIEHLNILDEDYYFRLLDMMLSQDLAGAMLLYDEINKKGFEGDILLNGFAEFTRNVLICQDERVASLLEVVESFRERYREAAKRTDAAYLVSILNILNESEIGYRSARNKRLHVEMALIRLCYLRQALELTAGADGITKTKTAGESKTIAFRAIPPLAVKKEEKTSASPAAKPPAPARLVIEEKKEQPPPQKPVAPIPEISRDPNPVKKTPASRISSLDAIRKKVGAGNKQLEQDRPLSGEELRTAWQELIQKLKDDKNPAWQSFEMAELKVVDDNSFEAYVQNNINQKFLELERNQASAILQEKLGNRQLQFSIVLNEDNSEPLHTDLPLSSREQYLKLAGQYPLVREMKERLNLDLDY